MGRGVTFEDYPIITFCLRFFNFADFSKLFPNILKRTCLYLYFEKITSVLLSKTASSLNFLRCYMIKEPLPGTIASCFGIAL